MGIFSGLFKSRDKPQNRTAGSNYAFFMGGTTSGKTVTERTAMQMTAVYSCVRILSEAVAGLPLHLYKYTDSGGKAMALGHPLYRLLHDEPNPEMSSFVFRETQNTPLHGRTSAPTALPLSARLPPVQTALPLRTVRAAAARSG